MKKAILGYVLCVAILVPAIAVPVYYIGSPIEVSEWNPCGDKEILGHRVGRDGHAQFVCGH